MWRCVRYTHIYSICHAIMTIHRMVMIMINVMALFSFFPQLLHHHPQVYKVAMHDSVK